MQDEAAFLQAMQEHPEDLSLRLVFADWLEEQGDRRGELLRLLHTLTQEVNVPGRRKLEDRLQALLASGVVPVGPFWTNSIGMEFAWIPAGTFLMGSPEHEKDREVYEDQHQVTLTKGFWLSIHPVTQACWREVIGNDPSHFHGDRLPVENVTWHDCQEFLQKLRQRDRTPYRLPTEAEWEFACRAGMTTPFFFGDTISTDQVNYDGNEPYGGARKGVFRETTSVVGSFPPNAWGLYDMHGNVWEWTAGWFGECPKGHVLDPQGPADGQCRALRGGAFNNPAMYLRSAGHSGVYPTFTDDNLGFRVAMNHH